MITVSSLVPFLLDALRLFITYMYWFYFYFFFLLLLHKSIHVIIEKYFIITVKVYFYLHN